MKNQMWNIITNRLLESRINCKYEPFNFLVKTMMLQFCVKNEQLLDKISVRSLVCWYTFDFDCFPGKLLISDRDAVRTHCLFHLIDFWKNSKMVYCLVVKRVPLYCIFNHVNHVPSIIWCYCNLVTHKHQNNTRIRNRINFCSINFATHFDFSTVCFSLFLYISNLSDSPPSLSTCCTHRHTHKIWHPTSTLIHKWAWQMKMKIHFR